MTEIHPDPEDNPNLCLMPRCMREVFERGMCADHYAMAYPEDTTHLRDQIVQEHAIHPLNMKLAKERHQLQRRRRTMPPTAPAKSAAPEPCEELEFSAETAIPTPQWTVLIGGEQVVPPLPTDPDALHQWWNERIGRNVRSSDGSRHDL
jgi:hypothetical protein